MGLMILSAHTALESYIRGTSWTACGFSLENTVHTNTRHKLYMFVSYFPRHVSAIRIDHHHMEDGYRKKSATEEASSVALFPLFCEPKFKFLLEYLHCCSSVIG
jgi:hypothetical protein